MKKKLCAGILCLAQLICFGTDPVSESLPFKNKDNNNSVVVYSEDVKWKTEYKDKQVLIESSIVLYDDIASGMKHERIVFKYSNLTNNILTVLFDRTLYYNGVCYGCDHHEKKYTITLQPLESKEYSKEEKNKTFFIFSKDLNNTITKTLDSFQLLNIEKQIK